MKPKLICQLVAAIVLGLVSTSLAGTFSDNFNTSHSFSSNGVAGTHWTGITAGTNNPGTVASWNANISEAGTLTLTNTGGSWRATGDGPFLWTRVSGAGDFTNIVHVSDMSQVNYNMAGLIVRDPNTAAQNYVMLAFFAEFNVACIYRDTVNGSDSDVAYSPFYHVETNKTTWASWLRIVRQSGIISLSCATNNVDWEPIYTSPRIDLTNDLQVGIMNSTYTPNQAWAKYQNFSVEGPAVPSPTPPAPATDLVLTPQSGSLGVSWTPSGDGSVVVVRRAAPIIRQPVDGVTYTGNASFGSGNSLGESNYVAYVGAGSSFTLTNVSPTIPYTVAVYSYTGAGASTVYAISNAPYASAAPFGTPSGIVLSFAGTNAVANDDTIQAEVSLVFAGGGSVDVTGSSTFGTGNASLATVSASGLISSFVNAGTVTISATNSGFNAASNLTVIKIPVTDDFSTPRNYLTAGVVGTIWTGLRLNTNDLNPSIGETATGNPVINYANANTTKAGRLAVSTTGGGYGGGESAGFFLYRTVSGDFDIAIQIPRFDSVTDTNAWHMPGLMVRAPFDLLYYESFYQYHAFNEFGIGNFSRRVINGTFSEDVFSPSGMPAPQYIRIQRQTNTFNFYEKMHGLDAWALRSSEDRPEWDGLPMQVGIVDQTFTDNTASTEFDNLIFTAAAGISNNVNAPSAPSVLMLASNGVGQVAVNWTAGAGSSGSVVIAKSPLPITRQPSDGDDFSITANPDFQSGNNLGASNIVVYAGAGTSVTVSNLPIDLCNFSVYSYKTLGGTNYYNTLSPATGSINLAPTPPAVTMGITNNGGGVIQISWAQGTLLEATNIVGPWTTNVATSPLLLTNPAGMKFFRVKVQ